MTSNPKIQELIKSMGIIPESEHYDIAERVIQECVSVCINGRVGKQDYNTGRLHCSFDIKDHFGVN